MGSIHKELKARQRAERDSYPENLSLRLHRALSWLDRAEQDDDPDSRFIFLWIARELEGIEADLESDTSKLARARELHPVLLENCQKQQSLDIDSESVERLKDMTSELDRLAIQQDAVATRLQFDLTDDQSATLNCERVIGRSERLLIKPAEFAIKGAGSVLQMLGQSFAHDAIVSAPQVSSTATVDIALAQVCRRCPRLA